MAGASSDGPPAASSSAPSLWGRLLHEYGPAKLGQRRESHVLVLGSPGCGARTLIARLQGRDPTDGQRSFSLHYGHHSVAADADDDPVGLLHYWHLEGPQYADLLPVVLTRERLLRLLVLIVVDLTVPQTILATVEEWSQRLAAAVADLTAADPSLAADLQRRGHTSDTVSIVADSETDSAVSSAVARPVGGLSQSIHAPIIVVGSKADQMEAVITRDNATLLWGEVGPKPPLQILNFIQLHLRKWCLTQGAALVYTSTVSNLHVPLLRDLIAHHAFGTPIPPDGPSPKPDAVFIPAGRDSLPEIGRLEVSAMGDTPGGTPYSLVIRCPAAPEDVGTDAPLPGIEHQEFLAKQRELLLKRDKSGDVLKSLPLTATKPPTAPIVPKKLSKDFASPPSGDRVQKDAQDFFASMDKRYKK